MSLSDDPVVVVGFAFRFPGDATSEEAFWDMICRGRTAMTDVPPSRFNVDGHYSSDPSRKDTISYRGGHFITGDVGAFDAPFFAMNSTEATAMDPQLRLLLETTYHALESAGIPMEGVQGSSTSVYIGNLSNEYATNYRDSEVMNRYEATGMGLTMLSNRLSWFYDLRGPSISLDTACSSSLTGLHLASQSLLQGESDMSLVGGVQLHLDPRPLSIPLNRQNFFSPDSRSFAFDERANGYSRGEGVGIIVLKRLSKALKDGDTIRAVIRGTSINQDGRTPSISQPNSISQHHLIQKAYAAGKLDFAQTKYFEAHGTGTPVGDPIEAKGIGSAFSTHMSPENPLYVGSVKANIGHLEATAGIAGLVKAILVLERGIIPPNALLQKLNPAIKADEWNLKFPSSPIPWPTEGLRRASVNSFGVGGANAHVVLDDALHYLQSRGIEARHNTRAEPEPLYLTNGHKISSDGAVLNGSSALNGITTSKYPKVFVLTAADEDGIVRVASSLRDHLSQLDHDASAAYLENLAFTLASKRSALPWKASVTASNAQELQGKLADIAGTAVRASESPSVSFVFTGQGAQWAMMGVELLDCHQIFKDSIEESDDFFRSLGAEWSLIAELCSPASSSIIDTPKVAQPLCTAVQIALVELLLSWGISARAVVGHSSGEIAAAYCAGALSKESALRVAYYRGEATERLLVDSSLNTDKGTMLAVGLGEAQLTTEIAAIVGSENTSSLTCGCINSPKNTTVTGRIEFISALEERLRTKKVFARKLNVPVAYHSAQMAKVAEYYLSTLEGKLKPMSDLDRHHGDDILMVSSVTGAPIGKEDLIQPSYWTRNLVGKVRFSEALDTMQVHLASQDKAEQNHSKQKLLIIEVGPHSALERAVQETLGKAHNYLYDTVMRRNISPVENMKRMAGQLVAYGLPVDVPAVNNHRGSPKQLKMLIDLPSYPFNHSRSYWIQSRITKNYLSRESPRHDLLGSRSDDWNPHHPKWRFTIRTSDLPWTLDHQLDNTVIYPGSGMLVIALEGLRHMSANMDNVSGYRLTDIRMTSPIVIPTTDDGIEAQLQMHAPPNGSSGKDIQVWDFWIHTVTNNEWNLHCWGQGSVEFATNTENLLSNLESEDSGTDETKFHELEKRCSLKMDPSTFYQLLLEKGFQFGTTFQTLKDIRINQQEAEAIASVSFGHWVQEVKNGRASKHIVHPTTLDSLFHVAFAAQSTRPGGLMSAAPTLISEVFVSNDLSRDDFDTENFLMHGVITGTGFGTMTGDVVAMKDTTKSPLITVRGCRLSNFHTIGENASDGSAVSTSLFHQLDWKPDLSILSRPHLEEYCRKPIDGTVGGADLETEVVCRHFMSEARNDLQQRPFVPEKVHLQKYIEWVNKFLDQEQESTAALLDSWADFKNPTTRPMLLERFAGQSESNKGIITFFNHLVPILRGEVDPLDIMFNQGIAEAIYRGPMLSFTAVQLAAYVDLLAHKDSNLKILEVGAGTGSTTSEVIDVLSLQGATIGSSPRFRSYDFTDISPSFFSKAQERYSHVGDRMRFKTLDLERDPIEQGFDAESYDIVIGASVLHATKSIDRTLSNVRKLLKPGGQLVFSEPTNRRMATTSCMFGVVPGWWLSVEKYRTMGPLLTPQEWHEALLRNGFGGLELTLSDNKAESHLFSFMVSTLKTPVDPPREGTLAIVYDNQPQANIALSLQKRLASDCKLETDILSTQDFASSVSSYSQCLCLWEFDNPVMHQLTELQFTTLKRMVSSCKQVIWVNSKCGSRPDVPEAAMISGFAKSLMREDPAHSFIHLNLQTREIAEDSIVKVIEQSRKVSFTQAETDYAEENGIILIPRAVEAPKINHLYDSEMNGMQLQPVHIGSDDSSEAKSPLEVCFTPGRLNSFHFVPDRSTLTDLRADQVKVKVRAVGVNPRDYMIFSNQIFDSHIGQEFSGVITAIDSAADTKYRVGDTVCGITNGGSLRTFVNVPTAHIMKMPADVSFKEASSLPLAYATAHYGLSHLARLKYGETLFIHAAATSVGQKAIQVAQAIGATVLVSVNSPSERDLLINRYKIRGEHVLQNRSGQFGPQVMKITSNMGVDVVLNSSDVRFAAETWKCVAPFGRFLQLGSDTKILKEMPTEALHRSISFHPVDITAVGRFNDQLMGQVLREVEALMQDIPSDRLTPSPLISYKRSGLGDAFRSLQVGHVTNQVIIDWELEDTIQVMPKSQLDYTFSADSTYIITGGLGGIGRSAATWLAKNGAKHLILLSRSGPASDAAKEVVAQLGADGVNVYAPPCDISKEDQLKNVIKYAETNMPPIKGVIHGAMVIDNRIFQDYTLDVFQRVIEPRVQGTWNLQHNLPADLDFFVILGSLAGFNGSSSQTNYAATNSFLDAFARFRYSRGQHCVTLDLGVVRDIGYIAERVDVAHFIAMSLGDHKSLSERDLHFMFKYACSPLSKKLSSPWDTQVVGALTTPAFVKRGGFQEDHGWMRLPIFRHLYQMEQENLTVTSAVQSGSAEVQLREAGSLSEAAEIITTFLAKRLARALAVQEEDIDIKKPPFAFGVDSLVAVELQFWFSNEINADVPVVQILGGSSIAELGTLAAGLSSYVASSIEKKATDAEPTPNNS